ncbi:hypothetical protein [Nitrosopumilus sp. b2]|uniref:hypothetical protein n=1 Tax=Nitrosopumilus sp. b2 TaxID=2109908 RepID=UPI0015F4F4FB|nr:hypothetical protein [Nitrosopumilus sp. b2]KAF6245470.1 hypothetical protein C6989_03305 [Nitrosopumilus sp. b2]
MNVQKFTLILSGIVVILALVNFSNYLADESESVISDLAQNHNALDSEKIADLTMLSLHWGLALENTREFGDTSSDFLRIVYLDDANSDSNLFEETKIIVLDDLEQYLDATKRHKENIQNIDLDETYHPLRNDVLEYLTVLEKSISNFTLYVETGDFVYAEQSGNNAELAKQLEDKINAIFTQLIND